MSLKKKFLGTKEFYRHLIVVMAPILVQNLITNFVNLLDNIMVGQVGTEPMSGVAIVNQLLFIFCLCIFGAHAGAGIFTAQFYGNADEEGVRMTFRIKQYLSVIFSVLFLVIFMLFGEQLISLFLHESSEGLDLAATLEYAKQYLNVMYFEIFPFAVIQSYASTLRETGETVLPMKAGIVAVFVNMGLNYILIFGKLGLPAMGVVGAAIATCIARYVEAAIVIIWTHTHTKKAGFIVGAYKSLYVPGGLIRQVAITGSPLLLNETLWSAGMTILSQAYSLRGLEVVSAFNISNTVSNLFMCVFFAMGSTVSIMVGQQLGSGDLEGAIDTDNKLIAFSVFLSAITGLLMFLVAPMVPAIYNTTDLVKELAGTFLRVVAVLMPLNAYINCIYFTLRSGGKTIITFIFDSGFVWAICIPVATVLIRFTSLPIITIFICVQSLEIVKSLIGTYLLKKGTWVNNLTTSI